MTWLQCYSMNAVVMSKQKPELVAPILAHMHRVMCIDTAKGGMLQYDWKPQRVINTDSLASWEKCNSWPLFSCFPGTEDVKDPFLPANTGSLDLRSQSSEIGISQVAYQQTPGGIPLSIEECMWLLRDHQDVELVQYLLAGITEGF